MQHPPSNSHHPSFKNHSSSVQQQSYPSIVRMHPNGRRSSLHTAFIGNLSRRVSKGALWEAFDVYGRVRDVFISFKRNGNNHLTYAFVRFKEEWELLWAINQGNGRKIDGYFIIVKKASWGWNQRRSSTSSFDGHFVNQQCNEKAFKYFEGQQNKKNRSFKDAVVGSPSAKNFSHNGTPNMEPQNPKISFDIEIDQVDFDWLHRSAIGFLDNYIDHASLQSSFFREGFYCHVRPMGGNCVLLTFSEAEDMEECLKNFKDWLHIWFEKVSPWEIDDGACDRFVWLRLERVPLHLWTKKFFMSVGKLWGFYVTTDDSTHRLLRFDVARILVPVKADSIIPSSIHFKANGEIFNTSITEESVCNFPVMLSDMKLQNDKELASPLSSSMSSDSPKSVRSPEGTEAPILEKCDGFENVYSPQTQMSELESGKVGFENGTAAYGPAVNEVVEEENIMAHSEDVCRDTKNRGTDGANEVYSIQRVNLISTVDDMEVEKGGEGLCAQSLLGPSFTGHKPLVPNNGLSFEECGREPLSVLMPEDSKRQKRFLVSKLKNSKIRSLEDIEEDLFKKLSQKDKMRAKKGKVKN